MTTPEFDFNAWIIVYVDLKKLILVASIILQWQILKFDVSKN